MSIFENSIGQRASEMMLRTKGSPNDTRKTYLVSKWAAIIDSSDGPSIHDLVPHILAEKEIITVQNNQNTRIS